jgi:hypothetical protein
MRGIAIVCYGTACLSKSNLYPLKDLLIYFLVVISHNRTAIWISNVFSVFKLFILLFIVVAGWVVLGGGTRVEDPHSHFKNGWAGTT